MPKALVTGATGFVGQELCKLLDGPNVLTRSPELAPDSLSHAALFRWDPAQGPPPSEALDGCGVVYHLAGESVARGRWTEAKKARIRDSRVDGTRHLVQGIRSMETPPSVLVSASAVGFYGSRGEDKLAESADGTADFLGEVCEAWEAEAAAASKLGVRVVMIRIGLVLGSAGGALKQMLPLFRLGGGGPLGNGRQWMPWVDVRDLARLFVFAAENEVLRGPVNGVAPQSVRNREFTKTLARAVRRPAFFPAPAFALRLALGEFAEVLLASQRVMPRAAQEAGFQFQWPDLASCLKGI